jgi:hypothetical protein
MNAHSLTRLDDPCQENSGSWQIKRAELYVFILKTIRAKGGEAGGWTMGFGAAVNKSEMSLYSFRSATS